MQDNRPDRPDVITLPPLILAATIALGLVLNFFWPASFLPSALGGPLGILITLSAIALGISAIREMFAANTPLDVRKPSTEMAGAITERPKVSMSRRMAVTLSCGDNGALGAAHIGPDPSGVDQNTRRAAPNRSQRFASPYSPPAAASSPCEAASRRR